MTGQIVVTVSAAKQIIATAIAALPEIKQALQSGKIILKGGTTVSALAELLGAPPMRISGRIAPDGARTAKYKASSPHVGIFDRGIWRSLDDAAVETELTLLTSQDVLVTGANAIDYYGNAGMLAGSFAGGSPGRMMNALISDGITTIIAAGLEKMIPGTIADASQHAGRKKVEKAMGMAVGLLPLRGRLITEQQALEILTGVQCTVIASGGLAGAEGATTLIVEGEECQVEAVFSLVDRLPKTGCSGDPASLPACDTWGSGCGRHLACIYRRSK